MRQRISSHLRWMKFIFLLIGIILIGISIKNIIESNQIISDAIVAPFIISLFCGILFLLFDSASTVEFDTDFMYIKNKNGEEKIPLKDIIKIKLTMIEVNNRNLWKISYINENKSQKSVRILPRFLKWNIFEDFKKTVNLKNKNVKIKNWSHGLDFDQ